MVVLLALTVILGMQGTQNPSPMVEHTRRHPRLMQARPDGKRIPLQIGTLYLPRELPPNPTLFVHFHGSEWIPEIAAARNNVAVISVQLGSGSATYARPFTDSSAFSALIRESEDKAGVRYSRVGLTAWSAGYGAIREILRNRSDYGRLSFIMLLDGLHCGYSDGKPGPLVSRIETDGLSGFLSFAKDAVSGSKRFLLTHTEIFPGTFASTTETADYLVRELGLRRKAVLRWGPMGTQMLSEVKAGGFRVSGFAGNSAPDHVDLLHSLPDLLKQIL